MGKLSVLSLKGSSTILNSDGLKLSLSLGVLASTHLSPGLIPNLRMYKAKGGTSSHIDKLARELFFQREDVNKRRYGPVAPVGSKSLPIYWLLPGDVGVIVGIALKQAHFKMKLAAKEIDKTLFDCGIECNRVQGLWTGVSLERYRRVIGLLTEEFSATSTQSVGYLCGCGSLLLLSYVWGKCQSKADILSFYRGVERMSGIEVIAQRDLLLDFNKPTADPNSELNLWLAKTYTSSELTSASIQEALQNILAYCRISHNRYQQKLDLAQIASSLDLIAASLSIERAVKPVVELGRYAPSAVSSATDGDNHRGAALKPDCVEVVLRELCDALLFDPGTGSYCMDRLTSATSAALKEFYNDLADNTISDLPMQPMILSSSSSTSTDQTNLILKEQHQKSIKSDLPKYYDRHRTSAGQRWFDLCQRIPGCEYLSVSPDGTPYELAPGRKNICTAMSYLLFGSSSALASNNFKELGAKINTELFSNSKDSPIICNDTILSFRAPFSDTEQVVREIGVLVFPDTNLELTVELERQHGLASVRSRRVSSEHLSWSAPDVLFTLRAELHHMLSVSPTALSTDTTNASDVLKLVPALLASTVLGDEVINTCIDTLNTIPAHSTLLLQFAQLAIFCPLGEERRYLSPNVIGINDILLQAVKTSRSAVPVSELSSNCSKGGLLTVGGLMSTQTAEAKAKDDSKLYLRLLKAACKLSERSFNKDHTLIRSIILWLLTELPTSHSGRIHPLSLARALLPAWHLFLENESDRIAFRDCLFGRNIDYYNQGRAVWMILAAYKAYDPTRTVIVDSNNVSLLEQIKASLRASLLRAEEVLGRLKGYIT